MLDRMHGEQVPVRDLGRLKKPPARGVGGGLRALK